MRKILFSLIAVVAVAAVAGVGSFALWSDTDTSDDNIIEAGSLSLQYSLDNGVTWDDELPAGTVDVQDTFPGDSGSADILIKNNGTIAGSLSVELASVTDEENGKVDPELDLGDTGPVGELSPFVTVRVGFDPAGLDLGNWKAATTGTTWGYSGNAILNPGDIKTIRAEYAVDPSADNTTMTDIVRMTIQSTLTQI